MSAAVVCFFMAVLVIAALWTRFWGLAERQFAQDEYYFIKSVKNILEFGLPRFPDGGYYGRGILLQYLTAASILVFGDGFFAYRFPGALFNVGTVIMAFFLARQFLARSWSLVLVAMLTFSSWEVEYSRFARMYSAFQFVSVCFFWALYRYSFEGTSRQRYLAVLFGMAGILIHELGVLLALFLLLPCAARLEHGGWRGLRESRLYVALSFITMGAGWVHARYEYRSVGVQNALPLDFIHPATKSPSWSSFGAGMLGDVGFLATGILGVCVLAGWYVREDLRGRLKSDPEERVLGGLLIAAAGSAVIHQFAISTMLLLIILLRRPKFILQKPYVYFLAVFAAVAAVWLGMLFFQQTWGEAQSLGGMLRDFRKAIRQYFFAFPDLYLPVINTWKDRMPLLSSFLGLSILYQILSIRKKSLTLIARNPVVPIVLAVIVIGLNPPPLHETRYCHFLYPLALCVGIISARDGVEVARRYGRIGARGARAAGVGLLLMIFSLSEDFNPYHLSKLNSDLIAFRTGRYERFAGEWYSRWDFQRPAEMINGSGTGKSRIIVSCDVDTMGYYLKRDFVIYFPRDRFDYARVSRDRGTRELWSGKRMISTTREIIDLTAEAETVWVAMYPGWGSLNLDPEGVWPGKVKNVEIYKPGRDKRIEVWKISLERDEGYDGGDSRTGDRIGPGRERELRWACSKREGAFFPAADLPGRNGPDRRCCSGTGWRAHATGIVLNRGV